MKKLFTIQIKQLNNKALWGKKEINKIKGTYKTRHFAQYFFTKRYLANVFALQIKPKERPDQAKLAPLLRQKESLQKL